MGYKIRLYIGKLQYDRLDYFALISVNNSMSARASWMHLDLDCFFASVEIMLNPALKGKPIVVGNTNHHGHSVPRGVIATASYEARKFGVRSGMPLYQVLRLCPDVIVTGGHYEEYIRCSDAVMEICARWAPKVEQVGLDECFLDFSNTEILYPDLQQVAQQIRSDIKAEVGITASIGLASTKVCAKVGSDFHKPDGFTYVPQGLEKKFLDPLPLRDLPGIGHKMEKYFHNLGVATLGELSRVPFERIENWGQFAINLWESANGVDNIWFHERLEVKSISRSETFYKDTPDRNFILAMLRKLTEKVGAEARAEGYSGRTVHVVVRYKDFRTVSKQRVLSSSTNVTKEIYDLAEELLLELWDHKTALRLVGIGLTQFGETLQQSLFGEQHDKRLELEKRVDRLREKYGRDAVVPASQMYLKK